MLDARLRTYGNLEIFRVFGPAEPGKWRRRWDSNPRDGFPPTPLAGERLRPLGHVSADPYICASVRDARRNFSFSHKTLYRLQAVEMALKDRGFRWYWIKTGCRSDRGFPVHPPAFSRSRVANFGMQVPECPHSAQQEFSAGLHRERPRKPMLNRPRRGSPMRQ